MCAQPAVWAAREVVHGGAPVGQLCSALLAGCLVGGQPAAARTLAVAAASIVNKAPAGATGDCVITGVKPATRAPLVLLYSASGAGQQCSCVA